MKVKEVKFEGQCEQTLSCKTEKNKSISSPMTDLCDLSAHLQGVVEDRVSLQEPG